MKPILGSLINVGGFAAFLVVAFLSSRFWWGSILDIAVLLLLWRIARPAAVRWTREVGAADRATVESQD